MTDESKRIIEGLAQELPREMISWRPQNLTKKKDKALALAYIDARDVMDVLDRVCGAANWQAQHFDAGGNHTGCKIGIKLDGEWVWKSDGAGESKVEGEKGLFSGSFKRAAVMWGVGRYLYDFENVYVPCDTYTNNQKKEVFSKFTANPWNFVKGHNKPAANPTKVQALADANMSESQLKGKLQNISGEIRACEDSQQLADLFNSDEAKAWRDVVDLGNKVFTPSMMKTLNETFGETK